MNTLKKVTKGHTINLTGATTVEGAIEDGAKLIIKNGYLVVNGAIGSHCTIEVEGNILAKQYVGDHSKLVSTTGNIAAADLGQYVTIQAHGGITCDTVGEHSVLKSVTGAKISTKTQAKTQTSHGRTAIPLASLADHDPVEIHRTFINGKPPVGHVHPAPGYAGTKVVVRHVSDDDDPRKQNKYKQ